MNATIYDIAEQIERLDPGSVDSSVNAGGNQVAGYIGHEPNEYRPLAPEAAIVGYYYDGGNQGFPIMAVEIDAIDAVHARLAALPDGALNNGDLRAILGGIDGVEVHV